MTQFFFLISFSIDEEEKVIIQARRHFRRAIVDECYTYDLNDDAYVNGKNGFKNKSIFVLL